MKTETETTETGSNGRPVESGMMRREPSRARERLRNNLTLVLLVSAPCIAIATQLNLSTSPLFLATSAKPNIVFLAGDSESMDYGMVTSENNGTLTVTKTSGGNTCSQEYRYTHPGASSGVPPAKNNAGDEYVAPTESALEGRAGVSAPYGGIWRVWNKDYNKLYYDPNVTYTPWQGVDSTGANYSNADPTRAYYNPYNTAAGDINLTGNVSYTTRFCKDNGISETGVNVTVYPARYYNWSGTGVPAAGDSHTLYEIRPSGSCGSATAPCSFTRPSTRTDCSAGTCTSDQELQNFANWFSYHRKRDLAMKAAIGKVVAPSSDRMAYAVLNNSTANVSILAMNSSTASGNKRTLLDGLYSTLPTGAETPLRTKLDAVGRYFECTTGNIFGASGSNCPIQDAASGGACQQNFTVMVTDGVYNDSFSGVGNADESGTYAGGAYADRYSNTLADIAMHYYERDLAPGLSDQVPKVSTTDNATFQHMVTYALTLGLSGNLSAGPPSTTTSFTWYDSDPTPLGASAALKVDDLRHAAYNGRGEFLSASSPDALKTALTNAVTVGIGGKTGSSAAVAVNSRSLSTSTRLYQARFTSGEWSGDLRALSIDSEGNVNTTSPLWSAKDKLKTKDWTTRFVLTHNGTQGIPFRWDNLTTSLKNSLHDDPSTSGVDNDGYGAARLNWLRGSTADEGTPPKNFRVRPDGFRLGDVVNSTPIFVGTPPNLPDLETVKHSDFRKTYTADHPRTEMIYVGANDGMLHGFDATTGEEKIAYVPSVLFDKKLSKLPYTSYAHEFYVDGTPTVGDAYANFPNPTGAPDNCPEGSCWRTVLVSGLGGGGKGVFALDVTDPGGALVTGLAFNDANAANIALWERTASGDDDMGYVYGQPIIVKVRNDASSTKYSWVAIFGNGYNSVNEKAVLYIVNIKDGGPIKGTDIKKIILGGTSNGLSTPAVVDEDGDYVADTVYAGDLQGNLWKIDISKKNPDDWKSAFGTTSSPQPLFKAVDGTTTSTVIQPITERPEVGPHPTGNGRMVYFGTGRYIASGDNSASSSPVHTFYGIWDRDKDPIQPTRAKLLKQTISTAIASSQTVRTVTNRTINWCTAKDIDSCTCKDNTSDTDTGTCLGWRDDLLTSASGSLGEMSVSNPVLLGGVLPRVIFTTLIPSSEVCSYGGTSWLMELNPNNGGRLSEAVFDLSGDGKVTSADKLEGGTVMVSGINPGIGIMPEPVILRDPANRQDLKTEPGTTGAIQTIKNYVSGAQGGRQSWRQIK